MSLHRYSSTIIRIKDVSTCFYYSLTSATASLQRLIVCYGKGFVMSGVFAASLQGAVWKSRVPQKWFNPNYPVSSVCFRPVSPPLVPSCCNLLSVDIYLQCNICCSKLWNMESASVRNNLFSKHAAVILMLLLHYTSKPRVNHECGYWAGILLEAVSPAAARHNAAVPWPDVTETAASLS